MRSKGQILRGGLCCILTCPAQGPRPLGYVLSDGRQPQGHYGTEQVPSSWAARSVRSAPICTASGAHFKKKADVKTSRRTHTVRTHSTVANCTKERCPVPKIM